MNRSNGELTPRGFQRIVNRHAAMLFDPLRSAPLSRAIRQTVKRGDVVIDIGTGLGVLAITAVQAGAKHVYAIDIDEESIAAAEIIAEAYGVRDRITFLVGLSFDLDLDEKADVIICETVGYRAFDENILATIADAKKRFLKRGGKIIPEQLELWGMFGKLTAPTKLAAVHFRRSFSPALHIRHPFAVSRSGILDRVIVWPRAVWRGKEVTDASPQKPRTHWGQTTLNTKAKPVKRGDRWTCELIIQPDPIDPHVRTEVLWRLLPQPTSPHNNRSRRYT